MCLLQGEQAPEQLVELAVGDDRRVAHVVPELVLTNLFGQLLPFGALVRGGRIGGISRLGGAGAVDSGFTHSWQISPAR